MGVPRNCYFDNLDDWTVLYEDLSATVEVISNELKFTIPDTSLARAKIKYDYLLEDNDYIVTIDITNYSPNSNARGVLPLLSVESEDANDLVNIVAYIRDSQYRVRAKYTINGVDTYSTPSLVGTIIPGQATALRIVRDGSVFKIYYYISSWVLYYTTGDFGGRESNITNIDIFAGAWEGNGGTVTFDNLIFKPRLPIRMLQMNQFNGGQPIL